MRSLEPAIKRAFYAARNVDDNDVVRVGKAEFGSLIPFLRMYVEALVVFDRIDTSDNRRLEKALESPE